MKITDQIGRTIELDGVPQKLVSVVPSQTELLYDLVDPMSIVGKTRFCIHPKMELNKDLDMGGTKTLKLEKLAAVNPDLIIANKEENTREDLEWLMNRFPVWVSDIYHLQDALGMISQVGEMIGVPKRASEMSDFIRLSFEELALPQKGRAIYLIWKDPYMAAGKQTFIQDMLGYAGFENAWDGNDQRYPEVSTADLLRLSPEWILLSSEPYPFKDKHIHELKSLLPKTKVVLVDGEMFSWYGSRLKYSANYFKQNFDFVV